MSLILILIASVLIGALIYVFLQPSRMIIYREIQINTNPEQIFPYINNSQKAHEWMPWSESDPDVKTSYSGPEAGKGSSASWTSTGKMGTGQAVIIESILNQLVKTQLTYQKPMVMSQVAEVSLKATNDGTLVRWSVTGENGFISRLFCAFMNMDKIVGSEFEKGLKNLKKITEANSGSHQ